jgi:hypothetical protein
MAFADHLTLASGNPSLENGCVQKIHLVGVSGWLGPRELLA